LCSKQLQLDMRDGGPYLSADSQKEHIAAIRMSIIDSSSWASPTYEPN